MVPILLLLVAAAAASSQAAAGGDRGPLACASPDFCPIYCGNTQPIDSPDRAVQETQLVHVAAAMRHGARTPAFGKTCFPSLSDDEQRWNCALDLSVSHSTDVTSSSLRAPILFRQVKYSDKGFVYGGNCSMGQLLPRGLAMSERNGYNLKRAYGNFLPSSYLADPSKVFLQSDNSDRVIASGNGVFRAIFKDDVSASYSTDSVPVVDWFVPDKSPLNDGDFCTDELATLVAAAHNSSAYKLKMRRYNETIQSVGKLFGYRVPVAYLDTVQLFDCLFANTCEGQPAVSKFNQTAITEYWDALFDMYDYSMQFVNASNNFSVASYQGGPFLAQLLQLFTMITNNRPLNSVPVFSIHATHDTTIKPILNFFGLNNGSSSSDFGWPPYSAMLVFELRKDVGSQYFVRVVYNGRQIPLPVLTPASNGLYSLVDMTVYLSNNLPGCAKKVPQPFDAWAQQASMRGPAPAPVSSNNSASSSSKDALAWQVVSGCMIALLLLSLAFNFKQRSMLQRKYSPSSPDTARLLPAGSQRTGI